MSCDYYRLEHRDPVHFSDFDDSICCTCNVNYTSRLDPDRVRALAYVGAAIVLMHHGELDHGFLPACLPQQIKDDIDFYFKDYVDS
jgi:hypothetical protein